MGGGTAGAVLDAISRQKQADASMSWGHLGRIRARLEIRRLDALCEGRDLETPINESFECFYLCERCGHLSETKTSACPQCKSPSMYDLRNAGFARLIQEQRWDSLREPPFWLRLVFWMSGGLLAWLLVGAAMWMFPVAFAIPMAFFRPMFGVMLVSLMLFGAWMMHLARRPLSRWILRDRSMKPERWIGPSHGSNAAHQRVLPLEALSPQQAAAKLPSDQLTAPLTGRSCAAYRIQVYLKQTDIAYPSRFVLDECHVAPLHAACEMSADMRSALSQKGALIRAESSILNAEEMAIFLRKRGLFVEDGDYELYELILPA